MLVAEELRVHGVEPPVLQLGGWMDDGHVVEGRAVVIGPLRLGRQSDGTGVQGTEQEVADELLAHHELDVEPRGHPRLIDHASHSLSDGRLGGAVAPLGFTLRPATDSFPVWTATLFAAAELTTHRQ